MRNLKEKIDNFFAHSPKIHRIRKFFALVFFPYIQKSLLLFILLSVLIYLGLKMFFPQYIDKIYHKTSSYFFYTFNLNNYNFSSIKVDGNSRTTSEHIIAIVQHQKSLQNNTDESFIEKLIKKIKENSPWINQIKITRMLPNSLTIDVVEYEPFAIWQNSGQKYVIDKDGNKIKIENDEEFKELIILSGKDANLQVRSLFNIFTINPELSAKIYSATWIGERRWDIRFDDGLLVKLPADSMANAWQRLIKIHNMQGSLKDLNMIDLRIGDKIYLQYGDDTIKEIRNFKL